MRATATFRSGGKEWDATSMIQFMLIFKKDKKHIRGHFVRPQRFMGESDTKTVWLDVKIQRLDFDEVIIGYKNFNDKTALLVDDVKIEVFNEK